MNFFTKVKLKLFLKIFTQVKRKSTPSKSTFN